jgi:PBSX family phage terminase large subunit
MRVGKKFDAFLDCMAEVEFLEGTTAAGKTTVGIYKFMLEVAESPKKTHIIAGLDLGTIEKNIINKDNGILDEWGALVEYNGNGTSKDKLPHILFRPSAEVEKIIYLMGYDDKKRWKKALGGQYGCLYIDEINIADMDFVREASMRCDYLLATLNPDDPSLPVYKEYINCSRPLPEWEQDTPPEILEELSEEPKPNWVHWFFSFDNNISLSEKKKEQIIRNVPVGTKLHKNKILGLRGKATGLVFPNFNRKKHVVTKKWLKQQIHLGAIKIKKISAGMDTSYSSESPDTIAMLYQLITTDRRVITVDERVYSNADLNTPLAPSDTVKNFIDFLDRNGDEWGYTRDVFIDSADAATITELQKYKRLHSCIYNFIPAYKKTKIIDRIKLQLSWLQQGAYLVVEHCINHIKELESYSWKEDKDNEPEDRNDHTINASQYAWLPYKMDIGDEEE